MLTTAVLSRAVTPLLLPAALPKFFRGPSDPEHGLRTLRTALGTREERFLAMLRGEIYGRPRGPYARLLRHAGCAFEDVVALVRADGVETALARLAAAGVRLSEAEFRGRVEVVRSRLRFWIGPHDVLPSRVRVGLLSNSSGSGGRALPCLYPLAWMALEACVVAAFLRAHGLRGHVHATDCVRFTGGAGPKFMMLLARHGIDCAGWFVRDDRLEGRLLRAYHDLVARELTFGARRCGLAFPSPSIATDASVLAWIARQQRAGHRACIRTGVSRAMDVARVAKAQGHELDGIVFIASGEPLTPTRRTFIEESGARVVPLYGFVPGGLLGVGCARPQGSDDMHVMMHSMAVIGAPVDAREPGRTTGERHRLLVTTLDPSTAAILLNVENGDLAEIDERDCGCLLGTTGLRRRVANVRSDRQLTISGFKYAVAGLVELVEHTLPMNCGGSVGDYQLLEEDDADGRSYLTLRVHPRVAAPDSARLLEVLRDALATGSRGQRWMTRVWCQRGALRVVRRAPAVTPRGKMPAVVTRAAELARTAPAPA